MRSLHWYSIFLMTGLAAVTFEQLTKVYFVKSISCEEQRIFVMYVRSSELPDLHHKSKDNFNCM